MGWDGNFLQQAVDTCTNPSGEIQDCPLFEIQSEDVYSSCTFPIPPALSSECAALSGPMTAIPGNVQISPGPGYAKPGGSAPEAPALSLSADSLIASTGTFVPGVAFASVATESPSSPPPSLPSSSVAAPTPTPEGPHTLLPGQKILSTTYSTYSQQVVEIIFIEEEVTVTVDDFATMPTPAVKHKRERARRNVAGRR
jgi:hypothetical protein